MKICSTCHSLIDNDAVTCPKCGAQQRHFPKGKSKKPSSRALSALKLLPPALLVVALMGGVLAFSLRESDAPDTTTTTADETTTTLSISNPDKIYIHDPNRWDSDVLDQQDFICIDGAGSYSYTYASDNLVLHGSGVLSALYEYQSYQNGKIVNGVADVPWLKYLSTARSLRISGFDTISPELFRGMPKLEYLELSLRESDMRVLDYAFAECPSLRELLIDYAPADGESGDYISVTLGGGSFDGCSALREINIRGVSHIYDQAFSGVTDATVSVSERLKTVRSLPETDEIHLLFIDPEGSVRRSVWEALLEVDQRPFIVIGNKVLFDYDECPIVDDPFELDYIKSNLTAPPTENDAPSYTIVDLSIPQDDE